jgi:hypothetical protein
MGREANACVPSPIPVCMQQVIATLRSFTSGPLQTYSTLIQSLINMGSCMDSMHSTSVLATLAPRQSPAVGHMGASCVARRREPAAQWTTHKRLG